MMTSFLFLGQLSFTTVCFCCELSEEVIVFFTHVSSCLFFCVKKLKKRNYANACFFIAYLSTLFSLSLSWFLESAVTGWRSTGV